MILESAVVMLVLIWYNKLKMNKACGIIGIDSVVIMLIITGSGVDLFAFHSPHTIPFFSPTSVLPRGRHLWIQLWDLESTLSSPVGLGGARLPNALW